MQRKTLGFIAGATLYGLLNWIPILGPVISGFVTGWIIGHNGKRSSKIAFWASATGFIIFAALMDYGNIEIKTLTDLVAYWILIMVNLLGFGIAGASAFVAATLKEPYELIRQIKKTPRPKEHAKNSYVMCPQCKNWNLEEDEYCRSCNQRIMG